jgi:acetyl-CoA carboxylase biotin carboxylase subunit
MFRKVLVANRGEIAVRVIRTLHEMGIAAVAVYSDVDKHALHVRVADEAYAIGPAPARESYLRVDKILDVARRSGAEAVHPGYGFLSENAEFSDACAKAGIAFVGPPASAITAMGSKTGARARMIEAGVPVVPGGSASTLDEAKATARAIGYPVMLKATMGGGGKGMRLVHEEAELGPALERASSEALRSFGDGTVYLEKAITRARHVEIQVLGDREGNLVHLYERDCSVQRRHQKVVEETPCPAISRETVRAMGEVAVKGAKAVGYFSAGTFEFLVGEDESFYFLEMNTRLQVEHPITEWCVGRDLVRDMVRIAAGEPLGLAQADVHHQGASIECRVYAEDPSQNFLPSPGRLVSLRLPGGPFVRDDGGFYEGGVVPAEYDPLISKLSVWAPTREQAVARMRRALGEYVVAGIRTNLAFHEKLLAHPDFLAGRYHTGFIGEHAEALLGYTSPPAESEGRLAAALAIAASRIERRAPTAGASTEGNGGLAPWVASHRAKQLGG